MISLTVCITTYNRYEQAKRAINSVITQTYQPDEIVVVEDGSDSGIKDWIHNTFPCKINYIKHENNKGLAAARNTGLNKSSCEWIAYLDDDNEWLPDRLEESIKLLKSFDYSNIKNVACIQAGTYTCDSEGNIVNTSLPRNDGNLKKSIMKYGASTLQSSFFFKKEALDYVNGFDEKLVSGIDHDIWMKLAVADYETIGLKKSLVVIHQDNIETMMTNTDKRIEGILQYVDKWTPTYIDWFGEKEGQIYAKRYFTIVISRLVLSNLKLKRYRDVLKSIYRIHYFVKGRFDVLYILWGKIFMYFFRQIKS